MIGLAFINKYRRRLAATGLALAIAVIACGPAAAQQAPQKRFLDLDPSGRLVWVYYLDGTSRATTPVTPADMRKLSQDELRRVQALRAARASGGRGVQGRGGTGVRHYTVGGNTTGGTKTQAWHAGEHGTGPHGSAGRTTGRTGSQSPFR